jgi:hypothetical protein
MSRARRAAVRACQSRARIAAPDRVAPDRLWRRIAWRRRDMPARTADRPQRFALEIISHAREMHASSGSIRA